MADDKSTIVLMTKIVSEGVDRTRCGKNDAKMMEIACKRVENNCDNREN